MNSSPMIDRWNRQRGAEYTVFVDESFHHFFGLPSHEGNFCYGAVGLPSVAASELERATAPLVRDYKREVKRIVGNDASEIKFTLARRLPKEFRDEFYSVICQLIEERDGFLGGFFTSVGGLVNEKIREDTLTGARGAASVSVAARYERQVALLRQKPQGPGQTTLLAEVLALPVMAVSAFVEALGCTFSLQYDPRQEDEDGAVQDLAADFSRIMDSLNQRPIPSLLSIDASIGSHESTGLQLADLLAGVVRSLFVDHPQLLEYGSSNDLITPSSTDEQPEFLVLGRTLAKVGRFVCLPEEIGRVLVTPSDTCAFPLFRRLFMAGLVSGVTPHGIERDIHLFENRAFDLLD